MIAHHRASCSSKHTKADMKISSHGRVSREKTLLKALSDHNNSIDAPLDNLFSLAQSIRIAKSARTGTGPYAMQLKDIRALKDAPEKGQRKNNGEMSEVDASQSEKIGQDQIDLHPVILPSEKVEPPPRSDANIASGQEADKHKSPPNDPNSSQTSQIIADTDQATGFKRNQKLLVTILEHCKRYSCLLQTQP